MTDDIFERIERLMKQDAAKLDRLIREIEELSDEDWQTLFKELLVVYVPGIKMDMNFGKCRVCDAVTESSMNRFCSKHRGEYLAALYHSVG